MHKSIVRAPPQRGFYRDREDLHYSSGAHNIEGGEANYIDLRQQSIPPPFVLPTKAHSVHSSVRQPASERALSDSKPPFVPPPSPLEKLKTKVKHLERDKANLQIQMRLLREDYEEKLWQLRQELGTARTENESLKKRTAELEGQRDGECKNRDSEHMGDTWYSQNPLFMTPGRIMYHHENPLIETSDRKTPTRSHRRRHQYALEDPVYFTRTKISSLWSQDPSLHVRQRPRSRQRLRHRQARDSPLRLPSQDHKNGATKNHHVKVKDPQVKEYLRIGEEMKTTTTQKTSPPVTSTADPQELEGLETQVEGEGLETTGLETGCTQNSQ